MKRIKTIANLVNPCDVLIDVGCDHCYLAIELLSNKIVKHVINIDINQKPLNQGIANLEKHNQLTNTTNLVNNGLKGLEHKINYSKIDYVVIAGMGSKNIIDILKNNKLKIDYFIIQSNKDLYSLRKWLWLHGFTIVIETIALENNIYYPILVIKKKIAFRYLNKLELKYGRNKLVIKNNLYLDYLNWLLNYENNKLKNLNVKPKAITNEIRLLNKRINYVRTKTKNTQTKNT